MRYLLTSIFSALLLVGCGGKQEDYALQSSSKESSVNSYKAPVASTMSFPVRSAYETITGNYVAVNLSGTDNASGVVDRTWRGQITVARRPASVALPLGQAAYAVDHDLTLYRNRDGFVYRDAFTVFFDTTARPLGMVALNSYLSVWKTPIDGLPTAGRVGASGGTGIAQTCIFPVTASLTQLDCSVNMSAGDSTNPNTIADEKFVNIGIWTFKPDTAETGSINFTYKPRVTVLGELPKSDDWTDIGIRIDATGTFRGIDYTQTISTTPTSTSTQNSENPQFILKMSSL